MTNNSSLTKARQRKNDEYFTPYEAIAAVVNSMPDIFRNKVIYCNCESGGMSAFTRFFKENFDALGLEQLIVTGLGSNQSFHKTKDSEYHVTHESSGSYASPEFQELLEQADIVITNPPFSSFKDYFSYILSKKKDFLIVAPVHSLCYKNVFPFIKDESVWPLRFDRTSGFSRPDGAKQTFGNIVWLTNLGERPKNRFLDTDCSYNPNLYPHYRNVDAIEVNSVEMIPKDYPGVMAVPSSFLPYMNRQQFELLGFSHDTKFLREFGARPIGHEVLSMMKRKGMTGHYSDNMVNPHIVEGDKIRFPYSRIFIRNKQLNKKEDTSLISIVGSDDVAMIIVDSNNNENNNLNLSSMEKDLTNGYVVRKGQIEPLGEREKTVLAELHQAIKDNIWDKGHSDAKKGYEEYVFSSKNYEIIIRPDDESQKKYGPEVLWKPLTELSHSYSAFIAPKDDYEAAVEYARAYPDTRKEFYNQFSYGNGHQSNLEYFIPDKTVVSGNGNMFVQAQIGDKLTEPVHLDHKDREAFLNGWATAEQLGAKNIGNLIPSLRRVVEREHIREDFQPIYNKLQESLQQTIDKVGREKGKRIEFNEEIFFPVKDLELPNFGKVDWIIFSRNDWTDKTIPIEFENDNKYNRLVNLPKEDVAVFKDYVNSHDFSQDFEKSVKVSMEQSGTPYYYFDKPDYAHVHHLRQDILSALRNEDFNSLSNSIYKQYELMGGRVGREEFKSLLNISDMSKGDLFNDAKDNADHAFYEKYHDEKKFIDLDDPRRDDHALESVQKAFHPLTVDENRVDIILAENEGNPEVLDTIDKLISKDESFRYQILDRMRSDMAYFIDNKGSENQLWSHDAKSQLIYMKALWYSLPERPHWLSMEQINDFQSRAMRLLVDRASDNKGYEVNLHNAVNSVSFKEIQTMAIRYGGKAAVVNGEEIAVFSHEDSARMFKDDILKLDQERTAVYEKKEYPVQGLEGYSRTELKQMVVDYTKDKLSEAEINDVEIVDAAIHGSRGRGTASSGSDLDVVIEYRGNQKEDAIFNLLHESNFEINGIKVDINPITESKTGSLAKYMETSRKYDDNILVGNVVLDGAAQFDAVHHAHPDVRDDQVDVLLGADDPEGFFSVGGLEDVKTR